MEQQAVDAHYYTGGALGCAFVTSITAFELAFLFPGGLRVCSAPV